jgi:UTP-glucose-1-phosphate uridylyltransferase
MGLASSNLAPSAKRFDSEFMQPTLLVAAAGMGSRYGGLKQVDPVGPGGETIIDYSIYDAMRAGFGKVVFVIRHDIEPAFKEAVGNRFAKRLPVEYAFQELNAVPSGFTVPPTRQKPWGTGHAILVAEPLIHEPFAMINADDFYGADSFKALCGYLNGARDEAKEYSMVGFVLRNTLSEHGSVTRGVCKVDKQKMILEQVVEMKHIERRDKGGAAHRDDHGEHPLTGDEFVSMNMWGFTPSLFGHLRDDFRAFLEKHGQEEKSELLIPSVVNTLVAEKRVRVKVLPTTSTWFGVTYKEDRPAVIESVRALIKRGEYPEKLWP